MSDFDALHERGRDREVQLLAFDLIELDGEDLRVDPLERRKIGLAKLLRRSHIGIQLNEHLEAPGHVVFAHASALGLQAIVSKCRAIPARPLPHLAEGEELRGARRRCGSGRIGSDEAFDM